MSIDTPPIENSVKKASVEMSARFVNQIQIKLMQRRLSSDTNANKDEITMDWVDFNSTEFRIILRALTNTDEHFEDLYNANPDIILDIIEDKLDRLHALEHTLAHIPQEKMEEFKVWHQAHKEDIYRCLRDNPELVTQYIAAQDVNPEVEQALLKQIEEKLQLQQLQ